jgi:hypothetical protein
MKFLTRRTEFRLALIMALALLCAQFAAQAHSYSHLQSGTDTTFRLDAKGRLCADCLSFAPLLAAAGSAALPAVIALQGVDPVPAGLVHSLISQRFPASFRSRAPPYSR